MVGIVFDRDVVSHYLLSQSSGEIAAAFLVLPHAEIRSVPCGRRYCEEEEGLAPCIWINDHIILSRREVGLVLVQFGPFQGRFRNLLGIQLSNVRETGETVSGLVPVIRVHCEREIS